MTRNSKVQLVFKARELTLEFANEEEFFKTLGIMCRISGEAKIKGKTTDKYLVFEASGELAKNLPDGFASSADLFGNGRIMVSDIGSFCIICDPGIFYSRAFYDKLKHIAMKDTIACSSYVNYLIEEFGFEYRLNDKKNKAIVKPPSPDRAREIIREKGLDEFLYYFEKGLAAPGRKS